MRFGYDGLDRIAEYDGANAIQRRYVHGVGVDEPIVWYEGSGLTNRRFLSADERGSIIAVSDGAGALLGINRYDDYGLPQSGNLGSFGYTGQTWLPGANLWYYKARVYRPDIGRFLQADPIGVEGGVNLYAYVGNDAVNWVDPFGTLPICMSVKGAITQSADGTISVPAPATYCWDDGRRLDGPDFLVVNWVKSQRESYGDELFFSVSEDEIKTVEPDVKCERPNGVDEYRASKSAFGTGDPGHLHTGDYSTQPGPDDGVAAQHTGTAYIGTTRGAFRVNVIGGGYSITKLCGEWGASLSSIKRLVRSWTENSGTSGARPSGKANCKRLK